MQRRDERLLVYPERELGPLSQNTGVQRSAAARESGSFKGDVGTRVTP